MVIKAVSSYDGFFAHSSNVVKVLLLTEKCADLASKITEKYSDYLSNCTGPIKDLILANKTTRIVAKFVRDREAIFNFLKLPVNAYRYLKNRFTHIPADLLSLASVGKSKSISDSVIATAAAVASKAETTLFYSKLAFVDSNLAKESLRNFIGNATGIALLSGLTIDCVQSSRELYKDPSRKNVIKVAISSGVLVIASSTFAISSPVAVAAIRTALCAFSVIKAVIDHKEKKKTPLLHMNALGNGKIDANSNDIVLPDASYTADGGG